MNDRSYVRRRPLPAFDWLRAHTPEALTSFASRPGVFFVLQVAALLAAFVLVGAVLRSATGLTAAHYRQEVLVLEVLEQLGILRMLLLLALAAALLRFGGLWSAWYQFENSNALRGFVVFLCAIIAWPLVTAGYNYFFDQGYVTDRVLLLAFLALSWWRPVFVVPFVALALALLGQITEPSLGGTVAAHKLQVLNVLMLFCAAFFLHSVSGDRRTGPFVFLTCALVAASYWLPALIKWRLDWLSHDHLYRMPLAAYAHGWLGHWTADEVVALAQRIQAFDLPLRYATLVLEGAFLLFLWRRGLSLVLLAGAIVFHFVVFAFYGFFFWTWIALDVALLVYLYRHVDRQDNDVYGWLPFLVSLPLIGLGHLWSRAPHLGWYDTPLSYTYRIEAITDDGERLRVHPRALAPYEDVFTMGSFGYLTTTHAVLTGPYGVTADGEVNAALNEARTADDIFALEAAVVRPTHRPARARRLTQFLRTWFQNHNQAGGRSWPWHWFHPPPQFWSQTEGVHSLGSRLVEEIVVTEVTTFYDGETLAPIRELEVARVRIVEAGDRPSS